MNKKKRAIIIFIVIIIIGAFAYKKWWSGPFKYAGTIEATRIDLPSRVATVVKDIRVQEGDHVELGQSLAALSCDEIELQQKLAQENFDRAVNLKRTGSISKEAFDLAQNRKQEMDTRQGWCEIKSPVKGTVLTRFLEPSEWVNPGTKIITVANLQELWTYFYVPQKIMSQLKVGSQIKGEVPELQKIFSGTIIKINEEAEFTPKNVQTESERTRLIFGVKVQFKNLEGRLKPGMTIESSLETHN